jgi:competence protein ComEA
MEASLRFAKTAETLQKQIMRALILCLTVLVGFAAEPSPTRIDINNAPKVTIESLPGVGPKLAEEIISGRPYRTIEELDKVKGIGPKKLAQIRPRILILPMRTAAGIVHTPVEKPAEKVNINSATKEELESLPGIGPKKAEAIMAKRPFRSIDQLMNVEGIKKAEYKKLQELIRVR